MKVMQTLLTRLRSFLRTRSGKEAAVGVPIVVVWLIWLIYPTWQETLRTRSLWNAPITGLEDEASVPPDRARGEAAFRKALALEWLDGAEHRVPVYRHPSDRDYAEARVLYLEAVRYGYHDATGYLGFSYLNRGAGLTLPVDAIKLFERGIKRNDPVSMRGMGLVLDAHVTDGVGFSVPRDSPRALSLYERAAGLGDVESQYYTGALYLNYSGEADERTQPYLRTVVYSWDLKNESKGIYWLGRAIEGGNTRAYEVLQFYYRSTDPGKSLHYGIEGAKRGNESCMYSLYSNFQADSSTYGRDIERAMCFRKLYDAMVRDRGLVFPDLEQQCPPIIKQ